MTTGKEEQHTRFNTDNGRVQKNKTWTTRLQKMTTENFEFVWAKKKRYGDEDKKGEEEVWKEKWDQEQKGKKKNELKQKGIRKNGDGEKNR